jgi:hypothetical protein
MLVLVLPILATNPLERGTVVIIPGYAGPDLNWLGPFVFTPYAVHRVVRNSSSRFARFAAIGCASSVIK